MFEITEIQDIMSYFGLSVQNITNFYDTSHNDDDKRLNYILDDKYVLKINSVVAMWETRLQEIHRLIARYRSIDVYCPDLIPTLDGSLSCAWQKMARNILVLLRNTQSILCLVGVRNTTAKK